MGLFTAVRDPGVRRKLAEACQPGSSNPILLSCAKKNGVGRQEEVAQSNPSKGFSLDSFGNRGAAAPLAPQAARYGRLYQLSVLTYF